MDTKKFFIKIFALSLPLLTLALTYVLLDPFHVIKKVKEYYPRDGSIKNIDFIGGQLYLRSWQEKKYDSFIFGSSRSEAIKAKRWSRFISGRPFHFHASGEGIWGMERKISFLDKQGVKIKNAIVVLDESSLKEISNSEGVLFIKHPVISSTSWEKFHLTFFKAFLKDFYFLKHINYRFFGGKFYSELMDNRRFLHDEETNDIYYLWYDEEIKKDSVTYFKRLEKRISYAKTDTTYKSECIGNLNKPLLLSMATIFKKHNTALKVIISPDNDRMFLNPNDVAFLRHIFGNGNVYDFSGINYFTTKIYHYYDAPHFRPVVADSILTLIYSN